MVKMSQAVVARAFNPGNGEAEELCKFEPSLVYRLPGQPRLQRNPVLKKKNKQNPKTTTKTKWMRW